MKNYNLCFNVCNNPDTEVGEEILPFLRKSLAKNGYIFEFKETGCQYLFKYFNENLTTNVKRS